MSALPRLCCLMLATLPSTQGRAGNMADLCITAAQTAARETGVPVEVLVALTLTETGRQGDSGLAPWPWALNQGGESHFPDSATAAAELVRSVLDTGQTNIDLGCFQLNWRWHGENFPSVEAMLDPATNATYAANFVSDLYAKTGSWLGAAAAYHSQTPEKAEIYLARFEPILAALIAPPSPRRILLRAKTATPCCRPGRRDRQPRWCHCRDRPAPCSGGRKVMPLSTLFRPTVLLALALMAVIGMMVLPIPAWLLDIGLALSFALAILMLTVTLFIERPLEFSAFPTILLASLLLRLALNVSSTKLIIGQGHTGTDAAGHVIEGFANFIMGGNIVLGLVIFIVLLIVNFIVITKGAGRMAEVGARFALDGMPGKQLAIDADMSAGAITHDEAKRRRETELAETTFFGSLDGASKFVKGDAVAGLLITALNIVVGLIVGIGVHGMEVGRAFETYVILTVGDGLVSQIPAVIISVAAALLLSRGGTKGAVDVSFFAQLGRFPAALGTVAALMAGFALVPGMPFLPFMAAAVALALAARAGARPKPAESTKAEPDTPPPRRPVGDILDFDEIHIEFAPDLVAMALDPATGLDGRIQNMRNHIAATYGVILPEIRLTDEAALPPGHYRIRIQGVERVANRLLPDRVLVLLSDGTPAPEGEDVREPVYGAAARWIRPDLQEDAVIAGLTVVSPAEVLATHLLEVLKANLARLLSLRGLRRLLEEFANLSDRNRAEANRKLLDEMIPEKVPLDLLHAVLRLLLEERVSVRNLPLILESVAEARGMGAPEAVCEHVRQRLGFQIVAEHRRADGTVPLIQLAPEWERIFQTHQMEGNRDVALPPDLFAQLANGIADRLLIAGEAGAMPALVTSATRRRFLRTVAQAKGLTTPVLSYEELGMDSRPALLGQVAA